MYKLSGLFYTSDGKNDVTATDFCFDSVRTQLFCEMSSSSVLQFK